MIKNICQSIPKQVNLMRATGNCQCINSVRSCEREQVAMCCPIRRRISIFSCYSSIKKNEEILLPPVRAVRLRYRHRRIVEAIPRYCSKKLIKKRSAFQRGHGLQLRNKRGNRIFQACVKCCAICFGNEPRNDGICQNTANTGQQKSDCKYFCK